MRRSPSRWAGQQAGGKEGRRPTAVAQGEHSELNRRCAPLSIAAVTAPCCPCPLQALPNGHISPALFVALRVLCAPDAEASGWSGIADALQPPEAAASGAAEDSQQQELGAVQVWPVLDADGHPLAADAAAAAGSGEQQQGSYTALLSRGMCELLQEEVRQRLGAYACSLEEDLEQLRQAGTPAAAGPGAGSQAEAEEQRVAEQAALLLRVTEKEVLHGLLAALERRLAVLPAADGKTAASGKAAAGAKRKAAPAPAPGKQKAAQRGSRRRQ